MVNVAYLIYGSIKVYFMRKGEQSDYEGRFKNVTEVKDLVYSLLLAPLMFVEIHSFIFSWIGWECAISRVEV